MTSILLRNISISHSYQDLATRTGTRAGQKRYARTSRRNTSGNIFTVKSGTAGFSDKPAGEYPQRADNSLEDKQNAGQGRKARIRIAGAGTDTLRRGACET